MVTGVPEGGGREGEHVDALRGGRSDARPTDRLHQGIRPRLPHAPRRVEVFGEAQFRLLGGRGRGVAATARVHHQQVDGVRPDVEHPEAHTGGYRRAQDAKRARQRRSGGGVSGPYSPSARQGPGRTSVRVTDAPATEGGRPIGPAAVTWMR